jgi:hypothetical protein
MSRPDSNQFIVRAELIAPDAPSTKPRPTRPGNPPNVLLVDVPILPASVAEGGDRSDSESRADRRRRLIKGIQLIRVSIERYDDRAASARRELQKRLADLEALDKEFTPHDAGGPPVPRTPTRPGSKQRRPEEAERWTEVKLAGLSEFQVSSVTTDRKGTSPNHSPNLLSCRSCRRSP